MSNLSCLSSLEEEDSTVYVQPHYKETYRLAIYALICGGKEAYEEFLRAEQISHFLSNEEILFILQNGELCAVEDKEEDSQEKRLTDRCETRTSTYFPTESDDEVPDLDLGWPEVSLEGVDTSISLLFHPPRDNTPSIKEVVRKQIQEARQVRNINMNETPLSGQFMCNDSSPCICHTHNSILKNNICHDEKSNVKSFCGTCCN
uniref:Scaffolding anchor of CK1 domain-containing protein n=1 Tax=Labrus bergylta TaxID=56723 RepID=A0A3Q3E1L7_9LABR